MTERVATCQPRCSFWCAEALTFVALVDFLDRISEGRFSEDRAICLWRWWVNLQKLALDPDLAGLWTWQALSAGLTVCVPDEQV